MCSFLVNVSLVYKSADSGCSILLLTTTDNCNNHSTYHIAFLFTSDQHTKPSTALLYTNSTSPATTARITSVSTHIRTTHQGCYSALLQTTEQSRSKLKTLTSFTHQVFYSSDLHQLIISTSHHQVTSHPQGLSLPHPTPLP